MNKENLILSNLCYIETNNGAGQILVFENYDKAAEWCKQSTHWTEEEIKEQIKGLICFDGSSYGSIFTNI